MTFQDDSFDDNSNNDVSPIGNRGRSITIDCDDCTMQATSACADCVVTFLCDRDDANGDHHEAIVFDMAEHRAVRWFADAGLVPTLRHRAASNS